MLLFSTLLDINDTLTRDAFVKLVIEWNQSSPHADNVIPGIEWHGEWSVSYAYEQRWLAIERDRSRDIIAVRYEKRDDDGAVWDTDYVMNFQAMKMAIRLERSFTEDALKVDREFSTPHFISMLVERGYLKDDRDLPVLRTPITIDESNIALLVDVINGSTEYQLPVVYVSKTYYDSDPVDVGLLASRLKGVAHVLVEKTEQLNREIRERCDDNNEYYGAIGIYYPRTNGHRRYLAHKPGEQDHILLEKVVRAVIQFGNAQMVDALFTWQGVNNALLRDQLQGQHDRLRAAEKARKAAEDRTCELLEALDEEERRIRRQAFEDAKFEADKLIDSVDDDLRELRERIELLTKRNEALESENQGLKAKYDAMDARPVLFAGDEEDLYQGEVRDLLLAVLSDARKRLQEGSRRAHIVDDVVESNGYQGLGEAKAKELKRILKDYQKMDAKTRSALMELGFEIDEDTRHYKLTFHGDGRYQRPIPNTPSDWRGGKNAAQELINLIF